MLSLPARRHRATAPAAWYFAGALAASLVLAAGFALGLPTILTCLLGAATAVLAGTNPTFPKRRNG